MFERYTEKARRVIFFARYEASQYGSRYIESEHILLGVLREDKALARRVLGPETDVTRIRTEIEKHITKAARISTSVEVPLSQQSKRILLLAAEQATEFPHRYVGPEHLLLALLMTDGSLAVRVLVAMGVEPGPVREMIAKSSEYARGGGNLPTSDEAVAVVTAFLANLESNNWAQSALFFASDARVVDSMGKIWSGREEIEKHFESIFMPYAKRDAAFLLENVIGGPSEIAVASVLWKNVTVQGYALKLTHRMTMALAQSGAEWIIFLLQVTPVVSPWTI